MESVGRNRQGGRRPLHHHLVALRMESVGRNALCKPQYTALRVSLSAWRAWVEIASPFYFKLAYRTVALRMESVGRNKANPCAEICVNRVALRMESVGRNISFACSSVVPKYVALRMESVGRNNTAEKITERCWVSLSAWRAWVEIVSRRRFNEAFNVALRMESVGRNHLS